MIILFTGSDKYTALYYWDDEHKIKPHNTKQYSSV